MFCDQVMIKSHDDMTWIYRITKEVYDLHVSLSLGLSQDSTLHMGPTITHASSRLFNYHHALSHELPSYLLNRFQVNSHTSWPDLYRIQVLLIITLRSPYRARHFVIRGTLALIINIWWSNWWWITHVTSVFCYISPAAIYDRQHHIARNRHNGRCRNRTTAAGARLPGRRGPHQGWHAQLYPVGQPPPDNRLCPRLLDSHFRVSWTSSQLIVQWFGDKTFQNSRQT